MTHEMRVVTVGVSPDGATVLTDDGRADRLSVSHLPFGTKFFHVSGSDEPVTLPAEGCLMRSDAALFPPPGGFRFWLFEMPPRGIAPAEMGKAASPAGGNYAYADTVEWVIVLKGEIEYVLPGGQRIKLRPADSIVQVGAEHRWENHSAESCVMAVAAIGASAAKPSEWMAVPTDCAS